MYKYALLAALWIGCSGVHAAGWTKPDSETLKDLLSDLTIFGEGMTIYYAPDGVQRGRWNGSSYVGEWKIGEDGKVCNRWTNWNAEAREWGCWTVVVNGQRMNFLPEDGRAIEFYKMLTYTKGNVENL